MSLQRRHVYRRIQQIVLIVYGCCLIITASMLLGPLKNDREIMEHAVRVPATIITSNAHYVGVEFQDLQGNYHSPANGALYPAKMTNYKAGDMIWVLYDSRNPELVKIEGRSWTLVIPTVVSFFLISTLIMLLIRTGLQLLETNHKKENN